MPSNLKKRVRARMAETGENYQAALRWVRGQEAVARTRDAFEDSSDRAFQRAWKASQPYEPPAIENSFEGVTVFEVGEPFHHAEGDVQPATTTVAHIDDTPTHGQDEET